MALGSAREPVRLQGAPTLHVASFRGAFFYVSSTTTSGGRKTAKKSFVNSDRQIFEDLGLRPKRYEISGVIAARLSTPKSAEILSYETVRDTLDAALNLGGRGVLVHPFYGRIENVVATDWNLGQSMSELGQGPISITFEVSDVIPILPAPTESSVSLIVQKNEELLAAAKANLGDEFVVTPRATGNFTDAVDKVDGFIDKINAATDPVAQVADKINDFSNEISQFSADVTTLIAAPTDLAASVTGLFDTINGLYATVGATFQAFVNLFDFGDDDVPILQTTAGRVERQKNRDLLNLNVRAMALGFAYENAVQVDFETVSEIDDASQILETEFQRLFVDDALDVEVLDSLTDLRTASLEQLDAKKLTTRDTIEVVTNSTSTRLLAFRHYGSSELGDAIGRLNSFSESVPIVGTVRIFTS